jgi:hypothetical protein
MDTTNTALIDPERVERIFQECLTGDNIITIEGFRNNFDLNRDVLNSYWNDITEMLNNLPDQFKATGGKGGSLMAGCEDKNGNLWTSNQEQIEQLFLLGMGIAVVQYLFPREWWSGLPGGLPFYIIAM